MYEKIICSQPISVGGEHNEQPKQKNGSSRCKASYR